MCFKNYFFDKKKNQAIDYPLKMTLNYFFSYFENINILNKLKQNVECGLRAAVC